MYRSPKRRSAGRKRDSNHTAITQALKACGCSVLDLSALGAGAPDILVARQGRVVLMEIKNPQGRDRVEPNQVAWHAAWRGPPVAVVRSVAEALAAVGIPG